MLEAPSPHNFKLQQDYDDAMDEYLRKSKIEPESIPLDTTINNGGNTDYYAVPEASETLNDLIEHKKMNFAQGNIFKSAYCLSDGRHKGTTPERELNKIIYYAERELKRIKLESN